MDYKKRFESHRIEELDDINHNVKEYEKEYTCIHITESTCCTAEINTTL